MVVHCAGCNNRYVLDERKIPARGAVITCRQCGRVTRVSPPAPQASAREGPPEAAVPAPPPEPARPARATHDTSASLQRPVSCPKCGHLFTPEASRAPKASLGSSGRQLASRPVAHVLLVEDQNYFVEMTREALGEGFETTVAADVDEAAQLLENRKVDLVILDLSLEGGQDGTGLLRATRRQGIPVLIFTARDETDLYSGAWEQLRAAGATDILIKGLNVGEELRQKVHALVGFKRK